MTSILAELGNTALLLVPLLVFVGLLFVGAKRCKRGEWNDEYLDIKQMRVLRGFCVAGVMLHHIAQKTAAPWLDEEHIVHGMDAFLDLGYIFVSLFFFASGYGLYRSYKSKENYFFRFLTEHYTPILIAFVTSTLFFYLTGFVFSPYTWYVAAIMYLYLAFRLTFGKCKRERWAFVWMFLAVAAYIVVCDLTLTGSWCYNTIALFLFGLVCAKYRDRLTEFFKRHYRPALLVSLAVLLAMFFGALHLTDAARHSVTTPVYQLCRISAIAAQYAACFGFVMTALLVGMKVRLRNAVFDFIGAMSLEFYLIHGYFVQLFSYEFVEPENTPVIYIKNVWLYVAAVAVCSVLLAYLLKLLHKQILRFFKWVGHLELEIVPVIKKDVRKVLVGILIAAVALTAFMTVVTIPAERDRLKKVDEYRAAHITDVEVGGRNMAAYISGDSGDTIVIMRGMYDPCPTLTMRGLADYLSDEFRVIVLDPFGSGFSDDAGSERSAQNITAELHEAVHAIGVDGKYILMPEYLSGLYALYYANQYPDEVKAVIGLDTEVTSMWEDELQKSGTPHMEFSRIRRANGRLYHVCVRAADYTGLDTFLWPVFEGIYDAGLRDTEMNVAMQLFVDRLYSSATVDEMCHEYDSYTLVKDMKYPADVQVIDIMSGGDKAYISSEKTFTGVSHAALCENADMYSAVVVRDVFNCAVYDYQRLHTIIDEKLDKAT